MPPTVKSGYVNSAHVLLPKQVELVNSKARFALFSGAVRGGKSVALVYYGLSRALPNTTGLLGAFTYPMVGDVILPKLLQALEPVPKKYWDYAKTRNILTIHHPQGPATILLRSLDDEGKLRGLDLNWYGVDEATVGMTEAIFMQLNARLSKYGAQAALATNPASKGHFLYPFFFTAPESERPHRQIIKTKVYDNPYISKEYLQDLSTRPESWKNRFMEGEWGQVEGAVYPTFSRPLHVQEFEIDRNWEFYVFLDHGYKGYYAALLVGVSGGERFYVFDELYESHVLPKARAIRIKALWEKIGLPLAADRSPHGTLIMDPDPSTDAQIVDETLSMHRIMLDKSPGTREDGITEVRNLMELHYDGQPKLIIHPRCNNLIREIESYQTTRNKDGTHTEQAAKGNDHAIDALRYGAYMISRWA